MGISTLLPFIDSFDWHFMPKETHLGARRSRKWHDSVISLSQSFGDNCKMIVRVLLHVNIHCILRACMCVCVCHPSSAGSRRTFFTRWTITLDWTKITYPWVRLVSRRLRKWKGFKNASRKSPSSFHCWRSSPLIINGSLCLTGQQRTIWDECL